MPDNPPETPERPKRLSLSQVLEMVLARPGRQHPSVTLNYTTAGVTTWSIDVPAGEGETAEDAERIAVEIHERMLERFPAPAEHAGGEVSLTRNAKGETQMAVSVKTTPAAPTLDDAMANVRRVYDATRAQYPMADGLSAKPGSVRGDKA